MRPPDLSDLCHLVPEGCGQVNGICDKLSIPKKHWHQFRTAIAKHFLIEEIGTVKPKYIVLHGRPSRIFFEKELNVSFSEKKEIANWNRFVYKGELRGYKIIAIPHLSGQMLNELWRSKKYPERRKSVKEIIQNYLKA